MFELSGISVTGLGSRPTADRSSAHFPQQQIQEIRRSDKRNDDTRRKSGIHHCAADRIGNQQDAAPDQERDPTEAFMPFADQLFDDVRGHQADEADVAGQRDCR